MCPAPLESSLVRILSDEKAPRQPLGAGFLATYHHIITCAHVICDALGLDRYTEICPDSAVIVDFPLLENQPLFRTKVLRWYSVQEKSAVGELEDIAVLELCAGIVLPAEIRPAPIVIASEESFSSHLVKMCGFPLGVDHGTYFNGTLQGLTGKGWVEIHPTGKNIIDQGFSGTAAWLISENAVYGMAVSRLNRSESDLVSYVIPAATLVKALPELQNLSRPINPYRGLNAFREEDAPFYFGRGGLIKQLEDSANRNSFTAVIGASGSGKSSLVFAGLIPAINKTNQWIVADCRPKKEPFHELAACLIPFLYEDAITRLEKLKELKGKLIDKSIQLSGVISSIREMKSQRPFLLIVDQFEEIHTLNDKQNARLFLDVLFEAIREEEEGMVSVVVTMRADFLEKAIGYEIFGKTLNQYPPFILPPISKVGLIESITCPAALLGVSFEKGLSERIVQDVGFEHGSLPLVQFCLTRLWERQKNRELTHNAYEEIAGVRRALADYAEGVYEEFNEDDRIKIKHIFVKLVRPGRGTEDTRQIVALKLVKLEYRELVNQLADKRLIVTGYDLENQEDTVEIVHEALIRSWVTLRRWIDEEREFLVWQEKFQVFFNQWRINSNADSALLHGLSLEEALKWLSSHEDYFGDEEQLFIHESKYLRDHELKKEEERRLEKTRVATQVASALRNPMTAIGGTARLLSRKTIDPEWSMFLNIMVAEAEKIENALEDLFLFVENDKLRKEKISLKIFFHNAVQLHRLSMQELGVVHELILPASDIVCDWDTMLMQHAVSHLLRNSLEAMNNGGKITTEVVVDSKNLLIFFWDNGIGIKVSDPKKILSPFYSTKPLGIGLGLSLAKQIVEAHNGKLAINKRPRGGTEVLMTLPLEIK
ncbi:ATP-binding protein [Desulfogranum marinum]|uniref:nSTAND1 domain-containing NTPase n=1 Tax=Desulfogranum marinum TaxID=453220 RepID=UPI0029C78745|nr:ATP-binding protein [Desulfogranum marinum]